MSKIAPQIRFWMYVSKTADCWNWIGAISRDRGKFSPYKGTIVYSARYAYELINGKIPAGLVLRHKCDNPKCVRPEHLEIGTQADNVRDCMLRGRFHGKVTADQVRQIRSRYAAGESQPTIAKDYGIVQTSVSAIVRRENWSSVL